MVWSCMLTFGGRAHARDGEDALVTVGSGEAWDAIVADCVARGLAGLECLSGIPGTVGGTPIQNVGAYGQEVAGSIERLTAYDRHAAALVTSDWRRVRIFVSHEPLQEGR